MWLLLGSVFLLAVFLLLLSVPVHLNLRLERDTRLEWRVSLRWLFGLLNLQPVPAKQSRPGRTCEKRRGPGITGKQKSRRRFRYLKALLASRGFAGELVRLLRNLSSGLGWRDWSLKLRFGMSDPADTGALWGLATATPLFWSGSNTSLSVLPDFSAERFEFCLKGTIEVLPLKMAAALLLFLLRPATLRAVLALARA